MRLGLTRWREDPSSEARKSDIYSLAGISGSIPPQPCRAPISASFISVSGPFLLHFFRMNCYIHSSIHYSAASCFSRDSPSEYWCTKAPACKTYFQSWTDINLFVLQVAITSWWQAGLMTSFWEAPEAKMNVSFMCRVLRALD